MPRPASSLWSHFRRDGPNKRAICKYCQHNMCGLVTRMRAHLARKCPDCPVHIKNEMVEADMTRKMDLAMVPAPSASMVVSSPHGNPLKKQRRGRLTTSTPAVMDEKADLDSYVAKAVLGAGLSVNTIENPSFIKLIKRMNPSYEPPTAFTLATTALDLEYTEVQLKLRAEVLDATSVCLGVESWSTSMKRSIISCVINTPNPGVFAFENTGEALHTPEVLVEKIESVMTQIGTGKVSVIVMDMRNESMKQAALMLEGKYPNITFLPSCAHAMNAMMNDILAIPILANTVGICKQLARYFSQNHIARAAFTRVSEPMQALEASYPLTEPSDSSPVALLECLFGVERNHHSLEILLAENGPLNGLDAHVRESIINLSFWEELSTYTGLLEPFLDMMKTFDSDYPLLSTFYHRFTQLWGHLQKYGDLAAKVQHIMSEHWQAIRHPAMYTAYILDPRFPDAGLVTDATSEVLTYLKRSADQSTYAHIVAELTRYTGRVGMFADDAVWESAQKCSPIHWWKGFIGGSVPHLQSVALRNLCFPASSGLSKSRKEMFEKIHQMNSKYMNEEQASKAALVYLNTNLSSAGGDVGVSNETLV
ncbi:hypothetical protein Poli38472_000881 [Pythium oligandrum]|uniref:BED-type domain-containing protein n=1 Tax=Pythium oligandrum TaxID=41045 RepID=A0A8K1FHB3_PYTOL|nr:hypothetical protein Poli38472_000881 [Pythium oligandrum]|eukprot:TMW60839.1 hypothetical protein Poli38472_000881 [Pythium oligandrum]